MSRTEIALRMHGVKFGYGAEFLRDVGMEVRPGEVAAVCGPNGSGKSTLLKLAAGLLAPDRGDVLCGGEPVVRMGRLARAKRIAYLPQNPILPDGWTVAEVVEMGDYPHAASPPAPRPLAERLDSARGLYGLGALWERRVETLSGGERRRVLLARTCVQDAPVLILDEPGADLDLGHQVDLFRHLGELAREGRTVLLATHDMNLSLLFGHRVLLVSAGGRVESLPASLDAVREVLEGAFGLTLGAVPWAGTTCYLPSVEELSARAGPGAPDGARGKRNGADAGEVTE